MSVSKQKKKVKMYGLCGSHWDVASLCCCGGLHKSHRTHRMHCGGKGGGGRPCGLCGLHQQLWWGCGWGGVMVVGHYSCHITEK